MREDSADFPVPDAASLLALARAGGPRAALAARRAAWLAEHNDPALAREALGIAARLEPLDPTPRLALARMAAEQGDFEEARSAAAAVLAEAVELARHADLFLAIGSSLVVEPAASLPRIARDRGARLVIINRDETPLDVRAHAVDVQDLVASLPPLPPPAWGGRIGRTLVAAGQGMPYFLGIRRRRDAAPTP